MKPEDDIRGFFIILIQSIFLILAWMSLQIFLGMYWAWAYVYEKMVWQNFVFYIFFPLSLWVLIRKLIKMWKYFKS